MTSSEHEDQAVELARQEWARLTLAGLAEARTLAADAWAETVRHYLSATWHKGWMAGYGDAERTDAAPSGDPFRPQS